MEALQTLISHNQSYHRREYPAETIIGDIDQSEDGLAVSEKEYWEKYYHDLDYVYEWNNGCLEVKPVSDFKGSEGYQWFCRILDCYFQTHPVGAIVNLDIGFRLAISGKVQIRRPDLAVVMNDNPVVVHPDDCTYTGIYDLCVESLSYSALKEIKRDTIVKKSAYEAAGVKEYYIIDARKMETAFYRRSQRGNYKAIRPFNQEIIRSEVMPGFQFRISDLHRRPSLEEMVEDDVYRQYVFPLYGEIKLKAGLDKQRAEKEKQRAEKEKQRAEEEKQRAEKAETQLNIERQRAEQLAAKLIKLGISA